MSTDPEFTPSADFHVATEGPRDVGLVFIGASLVAGVGDPKGQGWVSMLQDECKNAGGQYENS